MNKRQGVLEYLDLRRERKEALAKIRELILASSSLCEEDWDNGERICLHHGYRWEQEEPVCNGVLNSIDELEGH